MNGFGGEEQWRCSYGCESANQCEYNVQPNQSIPPVQNYADNGNYYYGSAFDDGVVPTNYYENNLHMQGYQNYPENVATMQQTATFNQQVAPCTSYPAGAYFTDVAQTYPPCQGPQPWNYAECYGYYGEAPCQFMNVVDMEDFMWVGEIDENLRAVRLSEAVSTSYQLLNYWAISIL